MIKVIMINKSCLGCDKKFQIPPCRNKDNKGKYCSLSCYRNTRAKNAHPVIKNCLTCNKEFKIFPCLVNIRKHCSKPCFDKAQKGKVPVNFKEIGYSLVSLHAWVHKRLAKPFACNHCGEIKTLDLANKSHEYKRDLDDWLWLCRKCHFKYDRVGLKAWKTRRRNGTDKWKKYA